MASKPLSLTGRALRLLGMREHSRAELERKLAPHAVEPGALAQVLDTLQAKGFINETRVLESLVYRRAPKLGAARIAQELQAKGLAPDAISQAMRGLRDSELARARAIWRKKFARAPGDPRERMRQIRFLASRGFSGETIHQLVSGAEDEDQAGETLPD